MHWVINTIRNLEFKAIYILLFIIKFKLCVIRLLLYKTINVINNFICNNEVIYSFYINCLIVKLNYVYLMLLVNNKKVSFDLYLLIHQ